MKAHSNLLEYRFLLVSLHIDGVLRETTVARRSDRLRSMNSGVGLGGAYDETLERINGQDEEKVKLALATLMWVCHSERPLRVDELCHALAVEIGSADFDPDNVPPITTLLGCCQGLITVDKEASTVRLIHHTLREYLSSCPNLLATAHSTIAETCLTYLNSKQVKELPPYPPPDDPSMPFLKYSSRHWGTHARREFSDCTMSLAMELLSLHENHISAISLLAQFWSTCDIYGEPEDDIEDDFDSDFDDSFVYSRFSGLHCASFFGLIQLAAKLIDSNVCEINQPDCTGFTPLLWAAENGHEEVARLLLEQENVDPNSRDIGGGTPLQLAASNGHEEVVKLLLRKEGVNINNPDIRGRTPLVAAARAGHGGVVKLLLEREDVIPNGAGIGGYTALLWAATFGMDEVVKFLLEREDVDPNYPDGEGLTPLWHASVCGHEGVVKLLLEHGAVYN